MVNGLKMTSVHFLLMLTVPHSKSGMVPRSSLLGAEQLGLWVIGKGGTIEWGGGGK
jgi:hypothetical protein